jgi:hypothetical protein
MLSNIAVIIRSVGERTEALCTHLVKQQVPESHVVVIHERPFSQAIRRSFEIGLDFGLDWTLCVDADLLLSQSTITDLVQGASALPCTAFGVHGLLADKLMGFVRHGGPHLYRTTLLGKALEFLDEAESSLRPETFVKDQMAARGHDWVQTHRLLTLHAFEQYYSDIYRVMRVRAQKSGGQVPRLLKRARKLQALDADFLVVERGLRDGLAHEGPIILDSQQWADHVPMVLSSLELTEKSDLVLESMPFSVDLVLHHLSTASTSLQYEIALLGRRPGLPFRVRWHLEALLNRARRRVRLSLSRLA